MRILSIFILLFFTSVLNGQMDTEKLKLSDSSKVNTEVLEIPEGYNIFQKISGDLNNDGIKDSVFIVKATDTLQIVKNRFGNLVDRNRRGILIFLSNGDHWKLITQNLDCFSSANEDGGVYFPPELDVRVSLNRLKIYYRHGRYGYWGYTFKLNGSDFDLHYFERYESISPVTFYTSITMIDFQSKKRIHKKDINSDAQSDGDEVYEETIEELKELKPVKLSEIKAFDGLNIF